MISIYVISPIKILTEEGSSTRGSSIKGSSIKGSSEHLAKHTIQAEVTAIVIATNNLGVSPTTIISNLFNILFNQYITHLLLVHLLLIILLLLRIWLVKGSISIQLLLLIKLLLRGLLRDLLWHSLLLLLLHRLLWLLNWRRLTVELL